MIKGQINIIQFIQLIKLLNHKSDGSCIWINASKMPLSLKKQKFLQINGINICFEIFSVILS